MCMPLGVNTLAGLFCAGFRSGFRTLDQTILFY
jgi:hypothetical protein